MLPGPQQETHARDIPDGPKIVARDDPMTNAFIKAILNSRDLSMDELAGRDVVDEAANIPDGPKTVARDGTDSSTNAFIKALLNFHEAPKCMIHSIIKLVHL